MKLNAKTPFLKKRGEVSIWFCYLDVLRVDDDQGIKRALTPVSFYGMSVSNILPLSLCSPIDHPNLWRER